MNPFEQRMLEILNFGREQGIYAGVKAEFEAEGVRTEEMIRLSDITRRSGLRLGIKIGGCEAVRDLLDCKQIGADYIIAPMIESPYALSKYIEMKNRLYSPFERNHTKFLFNMETKTAFGSLAGILDAAAEGANGVVFGRVDYTASMGLSREDISSNAITKDCLKVAKACRERGLEFVVGGGVSLEAMDGLKTIREVHLTRFETRKIMFDAAALGHPQIAQGFAYAGEFELLWLKNKRDYYGRIAGEDSARIDMLQERLDRQKAHVSKDALTAVA